MNVSPKTSMRTSVTTSATKQQTLSVKLPDKQELFKDKDVQLSEDYFGIYLAEKGEQKDIKRYTWKNTNKVQVQIITYGARITSIKYPDSKGIVDDIALGFDDLASYIYHDNFMLGATIGRVSNTVELATFVIDGKQYFLSKNGGNNHKDGGFRGFDKVLWEPYTSGPKVILSYTSLNKEEGYPGDVMVRITYELTKDSEFKINMEAYTTRPTIIDLSQLLYFNLGGHWSGPEEINKHFVTINANCFTVTNEEDGLPTGDIMNVIYSKFDYQSPKLMRDELNNSQSIDQNFCVNKGKAQDLCFNARVLHPPSGRMLEVYSNQWGINFDTANSFGTGLIEKSESEICEDNYTGSLENQLDLIKKLYNHMKKVSLFEGDYDFCELRDLIRRFKMKYVPNTPSIHSESTASFSSESTGKKKRPDIILRPMQLRYLQAMEDLIEEIQSETEYFEIGQVLRDIVSQAEVEYDEEEEEEEEWIDKTYTTGKGSGVFLMEAREGKESGQMSFKAPGESITAVSKKERELRTPTDISIHKKDGRIHGKGDAIYKDHCALCLRPQNYPNAVHHPNFPCCVLRPGETYRHTIVYRFMIKDGHPRAWIKRNFPPSKPKPKC